MKRGRPKIYPWERWFAGSGFTLRRGTDYFCSSLSMAQMIRNVASDRKLSVEIEETEDGIEVVVRRQEEPCAQAG